MNIPGLLKHIRQTDKMFADSMGVKVAQLNRRQKVIQHPNEESIAKLKNFFNEYMQTFQELLDQPLLEGLIARQKEIKKDKVETKTEPTPEPQAEEIKKPAPKKPGKQTKKRGDVKLKKK